MGRGQVRKVSSSGLAIFILLSCNLCWGESLKVGVSLPLSGPVASMGQAFLRGFELYKEDNPRSQERVKYVFDDSRYDGKVVVGSMHKFREVDKVDMAVVWGNSPTEVAAPLAERYRLPLLAISFAPHGKNREFVMTFGPKMEGLVDKIVQKFNEIGAAHPAAVSVDLGDALKAVSLLNSKLKGNLIKRNVDVNEGDFKTLIAGLRLKNVDAILLFIHPGQALTFLQQASEIEYNPYLVGGDIFADMNFQEKARIYTKRIAYVYGGVERNFLKRLEKREEDRSYFFEIASGYSVAAIFDRAVEKINSLPSSKLFSYFNGIMVGDLPVTDLRLLNNECYGLHFELSSKIYELSHVD